MIKDNVKVTAITYKGYDYQTLFGISILADWLNYPDKYQKVLFEATDETPQSLDDVVCIRKDNKYDYYQVKYTPSPEKAELVLGEKGVSRTINCFTGFLNMLKFFS